MPVLLMLFALSSIFTSLWPSRWNADEIGWWGYWWRVFFSKGLTKRRGNSSNNSNNNNNNCNNYNNKTTYLSGQVIKVVLDDLIQPYAKRCPWHNLSIYIYKCVYIFIYVHTITHSLRSVPSGPSGAIDTKHSSNDPVGLKDGTWNLMIMGVSWKNTPFSHWFLPGPK